MEHQDMTDNTEQQPESVAAWMKSLGFEYDPNGYGNAEYWRVIDGKLDMYVTAEQAAFFHRVQHQQIVESTEQQAVGAEEATDLLNILADGIFSHDGVDLGAPANTSKMLNSLVEAITRHYIVKEAVAAALKNPNTPCNEHHSCYQQGIYDGFQEARQALNLDSGTSREEA